jgi:hypothetical protein
MPEPNQEESMKTLIAALVLSAVATAVYAEGTNDTQRFDRMKQIKLQGIDGRLSALQQDRGCVQAATTNDAMKSCEQAWRQNMQRLEQQQKSSWESLKSK